MEKFNILEGIAATMPLINIDTDMLIPKQFLKTIKRTGLGENLFFEMRYDQSGNEIKDFILNKEHYSKASIIVGGANFGCGSSREHAPWALKDFGIKCIISTSFADIFFNNCFKNGILPIKLKQQEIDYLMREAEKKNQLTVDLSDQLISSEKKKFFKFDVDPFRKKCLLEGLDDIALTLKKSNKINDYEDRLENEKPWIILKE